MKPYHHQDGLTNNCITSYTILHILLNLITYDKNYYPVSKGSFLPYRKRLAQVKCFSKN